MTTVKFCNVTFPLVNFEVCAVFSSEMPIFIIRHFEITLCKYLEMIVKLPEWQLNRHMCCNDYAAAFVNKMRHKINLSTNN